MGGWLRLYRRSRMGSGNSGNEMVVVLSLSPSFPFVSLLPHLLFFVISSPPCTCALPQFPSLPLPSHSSARPSPIVVVPFPFLFPCTKLPKPSTAIPSPLPSSPFALHHLYLCCRCLCELCECKSLISCC